MYLSEYTKSRKLSKFKKCYVLLIGDEYLPSMKKHHHKKDGVDLICWHLLMDGRLIIHYTDRVKVVGRLAARNIFRADDLSDSDLLILFGGNEVVERRPINHFDNYDGNLWAETELPEFNLLTI